VPPPKDADDLPLRALIFDSHYDAYKGVVAYVRVVEGKLKSTDVLRMFATKVDMRPVEIGIFSPGMTPVQSLGSGEVGYIATGFKTVHECRVGDTITLALLPPVSDPLPGYRTPKPMVFAGIYPVEADDYHRTARVAGEITTQRRFAHVHSLKRRRRWGLDSARASSVSSTWRSFRNASNANTTWMYCSPRLPWNTKC
jgi:translation elongation factor EF-4